MMLFQETTGQNPDFVRLCTALDQALDALVGGQFQRSVYAPYNRRDDIHDVLVVYAEGQPIGCGSYKRYDAASAELKRIYVAPAYAGHGLGGEIVTRLEQKARRQGYRRCILETGKPLKAAQHLYKKLGYRVIPNYGQYATMPNSVCMAKDLG